MPTASQTGGAVIGPCPSEPLSLEAAREYHAALKATSTATIEIEAAISREHMYRRVRFEVACDRSDPLDLLGATAVVDENGEPLVFGPDGNGMSPTRAKVLGYCLIAAATELEKHGSDWASRTESRAPAEPEGPADIRASRQVTFDILSMNAPVGEDDWEVSAEAYFKGGKPVVRVEAEQNGDSTGQLSPKLAQGLERCLGAAVQELEKPRSDWDREPWASFERTVNEHAKEPGAVESSGDNRKAVLA